MADKDIAPEKCKRCQHLKIATSPFECETCFITWRMNKKWNRNVGRMEEPDFVPEVCKKCRLLKFATAPFDCAVCFEKWETKELGKMEYSRKNRELICRGDAKFELINLDAELDAETVQRCIEAVDRCSQKEDVIHCVECLHLGFKDFSGVCKIDGLAGIVQPGDYCSRGVRREE